MIHNRQVYDMNSSNTPMPLLREIAAASPHLEDELLAERIERLFDDRGVDPQFLALSTMIGAIPLLRSRPISLDAAVDVTVRALLATGLSIAEVERRLLQDAPEFSEAIQAHMALRSMMSTVRGRQRDTDLDRLGSLPVSFGPPLPDGRPRYELVEYVGGGSDGGVFRAYDRKSSADGRPLVVAIKQLHAPAHEVAERVAGEAARSARLRHPAIASLLDWDQAGDGAYLVYEFIEGTTLLQWRRTHGTPDPRKAAEIVRVIAEGIQAAHNAGVVHRDLKPNNIVMSPRDEPFITDLGLAEALAGGRAGRAGGSLGFAAPEQLRGGAGATDAAVDVYALGGLLYWLLNDRYPNGDTVRDAERTLHSPDRRAPEHEAKSTGRARILHEISRRALAPEPSARYSSAGLLAADLTRWLANEPVLPFERSAPQRLRLAARRSPLAAVAVLGLLLTVVGTTLAGWRLDVVRREDQLRHEREIHDLELAAAKARIDQDQRRIAEARAVVQECVDAARHFSNAAGDTSWLAMFSSLEALNSVEVLAAPGVAGELMTERIRRMTALLDEADASGQRDTAEMAMWETALAYWLLRADRLEEARSVAAPNVERLGRLLRAEDPWVVLAQGLDRIATVRASPDSVEAAEARLWLAANRDQMPKETGAMVSAVLESPDQ